MSGGRTSPCLLAASVQASRHAQLDQEASGALVGVGEEAGKSPWLVVQCVGRGQTEPGRELEGGMAWESSRALPEHPAPQTRAAIHLRAMGQPIPGIVPAAQARQLPTDFPLPSFPAEGVWD